MYVEDDKSKKLIKKGNKVLFAVGVEQVENLKNKIIVLCNLHHHIEIYMLSQSSDSKRFICCDNHQTARAFLSDDKNNI